MGFLAPAAPFVPMLVGAGVGAIADKNNPLRGAMLGAVGGSALGPTMAGLTAGGTAAAEAAATAGMAPEAAAAATQLGAVAPAGYGAEQLAMMGEQIAGGGLNMGTQGISHALGSMGMDTIPAKLSAMAVSGPQGLLGSMDPKRLALQGGKMILGMNQPQPQMQAPPPAAAGASPPPRPNFQPVDRFVTGMPSVARRKDPREEMWGGYS